MSEDYANSTLKSKDPVNIREKKRSKYEKSTRMVPKAPRECCNPFLCKYALLFMLLGILQLCLSSENEHFSSKIDENR